MFPPIKIDYNKEIRRLTGIKNFEDFCASISKKLNLDVEKWEFYYLDEDNEEISFSSAEEFQHVVTTYPKIPKIRITCEEDEEDSIDIGSSFLNIGTTVSICERPAPKENDKISSEKLDESNDEIEHEIIEDFKDEVKEEVKEALSEQHSEQLSEHDSEQQPEEHPEQHSEKHSEQNSEQHSEEPEFLYEIMPETEEKHEESKVDRSQEMEILEFNEKGTSTNYDGVLTNNNSIQTQSVEIVNAATDVENLILNHDENLGTEMLKTEDKSNQKEVNLVDWASDPVEVEKASQEVNTDIVEEQKIEQKEQKIYSQEELDCKLSEIVKQLMKEMTPMMIEECHKYIQKNVSENSQNENKGLEMYHEEVHNSNSWIKHLNNENPIHSLCQKWKKNTIFEVIFRCRNCKHEENKFEDNSDNNGKKIPLNFVYLILHLEHHQNDSEDDNLHSKMKKLISSDHEDSQVLDKDPVIEEEKVPAENPVVINNSINKNKMPLSKDKLKQLKSIKMLPENAVHTINLNNDDFMINFEIQNNDGENNTSWPVYSSICCISPSEDWLISCSTTKNEVDVGFTAKFEAKIKNPKSLDITHYVFWMQDEFGRKFGKEFEVQIKCVNASIIDLNQPYDYKVIKNLCFTLLNF